MKLHWTDSLDIAMALQARYPEVDPQYVRFTDLRLWIMALSEFDDQSEHCGEKVLEAVQMAWIEEMD